MPGTTDTVKAMLTPGEFVIRKEAVDMIGVPILEKLNDMPEAGGHSEIDRLIAMATLKNMTGMYGGGMVNAKQYMGGGKVDMYGHGGKVKNQMMMGYEHGGEAHGNLKPVPDDNPGLAKLPEKVRNKMGYMQEGGSVLDMALRRAEPVNFLEQLSYYEPPMAGEMGSQPKRNFFGEIEEGQTYGRDILRPHEQKYLDHYNAESIRAKTNLIGFLPEDRELMFEFLNRSGVYDAPGEESVFKNNPNFKVPENEKRLARKLIRFEEKIDERRNDLEKRIRVDSASKIPSQLDKYPRNLLSEEERKELFEIREQIQNSKSYQAMEDDQSRLYGNRQRREMQKELGLEPKEEYKSLFGFDPNRDRTDLGEDPREYEGKAPNMYDLLERDRKNFYSQYQKPRTGLLNLLGFMKGGMAKKKKKYGYQDGGSVSDIVNNALESDDYSTIQSVLYDMQEAKGNKADEFNYNLIKATDPVSGNILYDYQSAKGVGLGSKGKEMQVSEIDGKLYQYPTTYSGGIAPSIKNLISKIRGVREISNLPEEMMGMQEGGAVPFVPFDQRPNQNPASGYWGEPGAYYNALKDSLEAEREELVADTARNSLDMLIILDSLKQLPGGRIENIPPDTSKFIPSSPMFNSKGMGI